MLLKLRTVTVEIAPRSQKELRRVPTYIAVKLAAWIKSVKREGLEATRRIPGYHDEPLTGQRSGQRSIRLSRSYRAIYEVTHGEPVTIEVQEVTKHDY